jgi:hypothetical protein
MNATTAVLALLLSGFFAVACIRACGTLADTNGSTSVDRLFRFPGRLERFRRTRWQWFAMVALMLVLRLQGQLPPALEVMAAVQLAIFLALPTSAAERRGTEAVQRR